MACGTKYLMFLTLILLLTFESTFVTLSRSKSIVKTLPGYPGELPVKLETGYVGIGEKEEVQLFYYFCESERNLDEDPLILYLTGGPGTSAMLSLFCQIGPLSFIFDNSLENLRITLNPNSWTKMANMLFVDMSVGVGFSYATTKEAWISSDSILVKQTHDFLRKFLIDHPKFLKNPLYISGISYMGIVVPIVTLELYNANGRGYQPTLNIQGYILCGPLTDKFIDPNSRVEYSHRTSLISDDIYKSAILNCHGDYINTNTTNSACISILQRYEECTSKVNRLHILEPVCQLSTRKMHCDDHYGVIADWANDETVQQALNIRQGTIEKWEMDNKTMAYDTGKNDTFCYTYDIFSSVVYHKKLFQKSCRALIFSGDHDMVNPYVGIEQWISSLNLIVESPWEPFYVNNQVGGYKMTYARNDYSLTFATVKGSGHSVAKYKPEEALNLVSRWLQKIT